MTILEAQTVCYGDKLYHRDLDLEFKATGELEIKYIDGNIDNCGLYCKVISYGPNHGAVYKFNPELLTTEPPKNKVFQKWLSNYLSSYAVSLDGMQRQMLAEAYELGYNTKEQELS